MTKSRFTEEQMVQMLREADRTSVPEVAKNCGISEQTLYVWRRKFGTMEVADAYCDDTLGFELLVDAVTGERVWYRGGIRCVVC